MSTVERIKAAIVKLTLDERAELAHWFHGWVDDEWDEQITRDIVSGKLSKLIAEVDSEIATGRLEELP